MDGLNVLAACRVWAAGPAASRAMEVQAAPNEAVQAVPNEAALEAVQAAPNGVVQAAAQAVPREAGREDFLVQAAAREVRRAAGEEAFPVIRAGCMTGRVCKISRCSVRSPGRMGAATASIKHDLT